MRYLLVLPLIGLSLLISLAHGDKSHDDDEAESIDLSAVSVPEHPTYHEHARPIIEANCIDCHSAGQIADYAPFTSAEDVLWAAQDIKFHVVSGLMPPWMPSRANLPLKNDRSLSAEEIAIIAAWADAGAALGDPHDYAPSATDPIDLVEIRADLVLQLEEPYMPDEDALDDYRCFAFELNVDSPQFITGYEFIPDVVEMAHHVILYRFGKEADRAIQRRNYADGRPGWSCYGGAGLSNRGLGIGGWAPGAPPVSLPEGTGFLIKPGQQIVVQMHYNLWTTRQPDRSQVIIQLAPAENELAELTELPLTAPVEIPCPTGVAGPQCEREAAVKRVAELYDEKARHTPDYLLRKCGQSLEDYAKNTGENAKGYCDYPIASPLTVFGVSGHMHELGRSFRLELNPGGDETLLLLDIPRWDFHWQGHYDLVEPLQLSPGDVLRMTCAWDNSLSDAPRYVVWGEGTNDEMCFGTVLALKQ
ncbi:MAG: hypothetical protein OXI30_17770 [Chloroflexota bacterium]|nr:hypothetical protein [Chloroflexota bacterium]